MFVGKCSIIKLTMSMFKISAFLVADDSFKDSVYAESLKKIISNKKCFVLNTDIANLWIENLIIKIYFLSMTSSSVRKYDCFITKSVTRKFARTIIYRDDRPHV